MTKAEKTPPAGRERATMPVMTDHPLHPSSLAALLSAAEAHELAAAVLRTRDPAASTAHADLARGLRGKASPVLRAARG